MSVREILKKIIDKLTEQSSTRTLGLLLRKSIEINPDDYKQFNQEKRTEIQRVALNSLLNAIQDNQFEELNDEAENSLVHFPKIEQNITGIDSHSEESEIIEVFRDVQIERDYIKYNDPTDILFTLLKMSFNDHVLYSFFKRRFNLRDQKDYNEIKRDFIGPLHRSLRELLGERFKDSLYLLIFRLSRVYGVPPIKPLKPEDVYTKGYDFYKGHEGEFTITFSTSSGLPNPLERYGTEKFCKRYLVPSDRLGDLLLKNPYRGDNFSKGILNNDISSRRIYIWERDRTSEALKEALNIVPKDKRQLFLDDAVNLFSQSLMFDKIRIIEIEKFDGWMSRFTRNAKGEIMFSIRGTKSKRISHAIHVNFDIETMRERRQYLQRMINTLATVSLVHPLAGQAIILLVWGEDVIYSIIESTFKRLFNLEEEIVKIGRVIKDYGSLEKNEARNKAEKVIEALIK